MKYQNFLIHIENQINKETKKSIKRSKNLKSFQSEQRSPNKTNSTLTKKTLFESLNEKKTKLNKKSVEVIVKHPESLRNNIHFKKFKLEDLIKERAKSNEDEVTLDLIENNEKNNNLSLNKPFYYLNTNEILSVNEFFQLRKILVQKTMEEKEAEKKKLRIKVNKIKDIFKKNKLRYLENNYHGIIKNLQDKNGLITLDNELEYEKLFKNIDKSKSNSLLMTMKVADKLLSNLLNQEELKDKNKLTEEERILNSPVRKYTGNYDFDENKINAPRLEKFIRSMDIKNEINKSNPITFKRSKKMVQKSFADVNRVNIRYK